MASAPVSPGLFPCLGAARLLGLPTADAASATAPVTAPVAVAATLRIMRVAVDGVGEAGTFPAFSFPATAAGFVAVGFFGGSGDVFVGAFLVGAFAGLVFPEVPPVVLLTAFAGLASVTGTVAFAVPALRVGAAFFVTGAVLFVVPPAALAIALILLAR